MWVLLSFKLAYSSWFNVCVQEQMPIPSVVIEPASSNEGDDDRDVDIISPTTISDNGVAIPSQAIKHMSPSGSASGLPDEFLYKVGLFVNSKQFSPKNLQQ